MTHGHAKATDTSVAGTHTSQLIEVYLILLIGVCKSQTMILVFKRPDLLLQDIDTLTVLDCLMPKLATGSIILADRIGLSLGLNTTELIVRVKGKSIPTSDIECLYILIVIIDIVIPLMKHPDLFTEAGELLVDILCLLLCLLGKRTVDLRILHIQIDWYDTTAKRSVIPYLIIPRPGKMLGRRKPESDLGK